MSKLVPQSESAPLATKQQIRRSDFDKLLGEKAVEAFQDAKAAQQQQRVDFEARVGRVDRIDQSLLNELQNLQMRFAAITVRQQMTSVRNQYNPVPEPKTSSFVSSLGKIIGDVSAYLATNKAAELFTPVREDAYLVNRYHGSKAAISNELRERLEPQLLEQYEILDDKPAPSGADAGADENCSHDDVFYYLTARDVIDSNGGVRADSAPDGANYASCNECDVSFALTRTVGGGYVFTEIDGDELRALAAEEPEPEIVAEAEEESPAIPVVWYPSATACLQEDESQGYVEGDPNAGFPFGWKGDTDQYLIYSNGEVKETDYDGMSAVAQIELQPEAVTA